MRDCGVNIDKCFALKCKHIAYDNFSGHHCTFHGIDEFDCDYELEILLMDKNDIINWGDVLKEVKEELNF